LHCDDAGGNPVKEGSSFFEKKEPKKLLLLMVRERFKIPCKSYKSLLPSFASEKRPLRALPCNIQKKAIMMENPEPPRHFDNVMA
jgi:hypothetical protein